ncbi:S41 family peptidase [Rhodoferax sp.]|uniref:S41 family peptidase n=1 Tax=Rhodoferax sp. TaxID=50421 RepID=UPI0037839ADE
MVLALAGCGGGGGGTASTGVSTGGTTGATSAAQLAQICSANNPFRADALEPTRAGSLADERNWIRAYFDERYLWYRDVPAVSANADKYNVTTYFNPYSNFVESINNYFQDLRNPAFTVTGTKVDKFSFLTSTSYWNDYSQGEALGYGWQLSDQGTLATRRVRVSHVFQSTQTGFAALASVQRGDEILSVNGNPVNSTSTSIQNVVNQALSPSAAVNTTFVIRPVGSVSTRTVTLTAANVVLPQAEHKVVIDQGVKWGYLLFNAHIDSAEAPLLAAMTDFQAQGIDQLVLDLRYNGGGYLAMASAVSYAIAGVARTQNKTFETLRYNDKRSGGNQSVPFYSTGRNSVAPFATLNLSKVYVLTTADTCSASESIINGLRGIDVEVVQIGSTTCGKPYGFVPQDNCGITYAAMEFEGVNDKGLGGFSDGFVPQCAVSDDLSFQLGVTTEPMFATAIARHRGLPCTSPSASSALSSANLRGMGASTQRVIRPHWQEAKILKPSATAP